MPRFSTALRSRSTLPCSAIASAFSARRIASRATGRRLRLRTASTASTCRAVRAPAFCRRECARASRCRRARGRGCWPAPKRSRWRRRDAGDPRQGRACVVPAHSASLRAFTPVFDGLWTRVNALMLGDPYSRGGGYGSPQRGPRDASLWGRIKHLENQQLMKSRSIKSSGTERERQLIARQHGQRLFGGLLFLDLLRCLIVNRGLPRFYLLHCCLKELRLLFFDIYNGDAR